MKQKEPYFRINNQFISSFRKTKIGIFISGWVFQGFLYMNTFERLYKIFFEIFLCLIFLFPFVVVSDRPFLKLYLLYVFLTAHTISWLFNGQFLTILFHMGLFQYNPRRFLRYTDNLLARILAKPYIEGAAIYGSLTKIEYRKTSDLDLRIIMKPGFFNRFMICHFAFLERLRAFVFLFPIDIFAFELEELTNKMSSYEDPIILTDPQEILVDKFVHALSYDEFRRQFVSKFF